MKIEVGEMPCSNEDCKSHDAKRPVVIFLNDDTGGLVGTCDKCGLPHFAKVGTGVRESWITRYCKANEATIRAAENRAAERTGKTKTRPASAPVASPAAAVPAAAATSGKTETKEEKGLWKR